MQTPTAKCRPPLQYAPQVPLSESWIPFDSPQSYKEPATDLDVVLSARAGCSQCARVTVISSLLPAYCDSQRVDGDPVSEMLSDLDGCIDAVIVLPRGAHPKPARGIFTSSRRNNTNIRDMVYLDMPLGQ